MTVWRWALAFALALIPLLATPAAAQTLVRPTQAQWDSLEIDVRYLPVFDETSQARRGATLIRVTRLRILTRVPTTVEWQDLRDAASAIPVITAPTRVAREAVLARIDRYRGLSSPFPPSAGFTFYCEFLLCTFTSEASGGSAPVESLEWDFGDGSGPESGTVEQHEFEAADTFWVTLAATDTTGQTDEQVVQVVVSDEPAPPAALDTAAVAIQVTPLSGPSILVGDTLRFRAAVFDSAGTPRAYTVTWSKTSVSPVIATINSSTGLATGVAAGFDTIVATVSGPITKKVRLEVRAPADQPDDPPPAGDWDVELSDTTHVGNLVLTPGERWLIGDSVVVQGNVLVQDAVLGMRPGSSLKILGADPNSYVGGGLHYSTAVNNDRGVWVWGSGSLDIQCTAKEAWNRTGTDATWSPSDEYWITPTSLNDFVTRRWFPGQSIPRADARVPHAEVINATRSCKIEGPGHIHINSNQAQRIEYVRLDSLGVSSVSTGEPVLGRYALHLHLMGEGSDGTVIKGVVAVGSKGKVFVPHASHGVTLTSNVSINSWENGMWWDAGDLTNRLLIDSMVVSGIKMPDSISTVGNNFNRGYFLGAGTDMEIRNSVAAGVFDVNGYGVGFDWPDATGKMSEPEIFELLVWTFNQGNVAHNNRRGLRLWHVGTHAHVMDNVISYRNGGGTENGSYLNANIYRNYKSIQDGYYFSTDFNPGASSMVWAGNTWPGDFDGGPARMQNCVLESVAGPPLKVTNRQIANQSGQRALFEDCTFTAPAGHPKVLIGSPFLETCPWSAVFRRTNVLPEDILFQSLEGEAFPCGGNEGTHVTIEHTDGRVWQVQVTNGQKVVTGG